LWGLRCERPFRRVRIVLLRCSFFWIGHETGLG
jgi:hypothetical protein